MNATTKHTFVQSYTSMGDVLKLSVIAIVAAFLTTSCTKEIQGNLPDPELKLVVDANIETNTPPLVLLTKTSKVFGGLDLNDLSGFFEHDAEIWIKDANTKDSVKLVEFCLKDLPFPDSTKADLLKGLGIIAYDSNAVPNVCAYTVPDIIAYYTTGTCAFYGKEEHKYDMTIKAGARYLTASTTIPKSLGGIDSLSYKPHSKPSNDTLVTVLVHINVPPTIGNFSRYWTKRNAQPFYPPLSQSVYDDKLFAGQSLVLPLERGQPATNTQQNDPTYGYFWKGDTVVLKWSNIDYQTYDFFYTLENDGSGNPFANQVKVKSNVTGGIGVFAGYATRYYSIKVPK